MTRYEILDSMLHFLAFFMGAGIGSFLNVVIYRLPLGISVNNPRRSFCPACKKQIPAWQNIPIFSWVALRGRCANCASPIAARYIGVELLTGVLFYAIFRLHLGPWSQLVVWGPEVLCLWVLVAFLVSGSFIDIEHFILPFTITLGGTAAGLLSAFWVPQLVGAPLGDHWRGLGVSFGSAAFGIGLLWVISELGKLAFGRLKHEFKEPVNWQVSQPDENEPPIIEFDGKKLEWWEVFGALRPTDRMEITCHSLQVNVKTFENSKAVLRMETLQVTDTTGTTHDFKNEEVTTLKGRITHLVIPREAMGKGDAFFLMMIGAFLGWKAVLFTVLAASVLGSVLALVPRLTGRAEWGAKIPFGPYLAMGALIWVFWGQIILDWYVSKLLWR
ncbi:MAG: prepilin peptidase [Verrucomicrobiaceae bacterium]|nr:prepilin peptidase [Verrucomicrobiaceae bacterium]